MASSVQVELTRFIAKGNRFAKAFDIERDLVFWEAAVGFVQILEETTPRATGRARHSWKALRFGDSFSWTYTDDYGKSYTASIVDGPRRSGEFAVASDVPYLAALENGSSRQAPSGFIAIGLMSMRRALDARIVQMRNRLKATVDA